MSLTHSPSIVTSGLVLGYDMNNTGRSWKGAPTTNMYADGDFASGTTHTVNGGAGKTFIPDPRNSSKQVLRFPAQASTQYHGRDLVAVVSSVYSFQMEFYVSADYDGTTVGMYPEQGGAGGAVYYNMSAKGTWQSLKFSGQVASTINIRLLAYLLTTSTTGYVLCANVQCELSPVVTPFTSTTRSSGQSVVDLTGQTGLTVSSLTYASNNTFSFNGTSDYLLSNTSTTLQPSLVTVEAWVRQTGSNAMGFITGSGDTGAHGYWLSVGTSAMSFSVGNGTTGNQAQYTVSSSNITQHVVGTYDGTTQRLYINGAQVASATTVTGTLGYSGIAQTVRIGDLNGSGGQIAGRWFSGSIYQTNIYSRALTAAEVVQNFQAQRSRYGV